MGSKASAAGPRGYRVPYRMADDMLYWLAQACAEARRRGGKKPAHIAIRYGGEVVDPSTIARFEAARAWPKKPETMVRAYASALDLEPFMLWEDAIRRWRDASPRPFVPPPERLDPDA